jgi:hypothetical protein
MSVIYELIGRLWVDFIKRRYRREIRIAGAGIALAAVGVAAYLASRDQPEDV